MALQVKKELVEEVFSKSTSQNPVNALAPNQWVAQITHPRFGSSQLFWVVNREGVPMYETLVRTETPGEVNIVVRKGDGAIAFVNKYRANVLPKTPENEAWRNEGNLDILTAPHLGMDMLELTRGWTFNPEKPWKVMTEGQEETGLVVEGVQELPHIYPNSGIISTWVDISWGFATDKPYGKSVDEMEKVEIKEVIWLTPEKVRRYMFEGNCAFSKSALATFRVFALESDDPFLQELGSKL